LETDRFHFYLNYNGHALLDAEHPIYVIITEINSGQQSATKMISSGKIEVPLTSLAFPYSPAGYYVIIVTHDMDNNFPDTYTEIDIEHEYTGIYYFDNNTHTISTSGQLYTPISPGILYPLHFNDPMILPGNLEIVVY